MASCMTASALIDFLQRHTLAVEASVTPEGAPQAAVVGIAVTDQFEILFDTLAGSRKVRNLRAEPRIALVVGWDAEQTAQVEGRPRR
jgi:pyridoxine/pyridoxamine 5'-phosphate oxidase